jgi:hypothetical protein
VPHQVFNAHLGLKTLGSSQMQIVHLVDPFKIECERRIGLKRKNVKIVSFVNFATNLRSGGWPSKILFHFTSVDAFEIIAWEYWRDPTKRQSKKALKSLAMLVS